MQEWSTSYITTSSIYHPCISLHIVVTPHHITTSSIYHPCISLHLVSRIHDTMTSIYDILTWWGSSVPSVGGEVASWRYVVALW